MNNADSFTVNDFTLVCKFISCRGESEFVKMYDAIGFIGESYAKEKFALAQRNFISWWCNLDQTIQCHVLAYVKTFYEQ
jgi:hypothetical protein